MSPLIHNICSLMLDFYVKTRIRFNLRDKRLFEITEVEITRVDCISEQNHLRFQGYGWTFKVFLLLFAKGHSFTVS